jgi:hypothetical protein
MRIFTIFIKNSLVATILTRVKRMRVPSIYKVNHPSVDDIDYQRNQNTLK